MPGYVFIVIRLLGEILADVFFQAHLDWLDEVMGYGRTSVEIPLECTANDGGTRVEEILEQSGEVPGEDIALKGKVLRPGEGLTYAGDYIGLRLTRARRGLGRLNLWAPHLRGELKPTDGGCVLEGTVHPSGMGKFVAGLAPLLAVGGGTLVCMGLGEVAAAMIAAGVGSIVWGLLGLKRGREEVSVLEGAVEKAVTSGVETSV